MARRTDKRNRATALVLIGVAVGMVGMSYAAVPLYRIFCQVTGYGGTTQTADALPGRVVDRVITVRFNADISPSLAWHFAPAQRSVDIRLGEQGLAFYAARNVSDVPTTGTATFNVTPVKAARYFNKIDCFCFDQQTLAPGVSADMPVTFFIDPAMADDRNLNDIDTITLSYTFFDAERGDGEKSGAEKVLGYAAPTGDNNGTN